MLSEKLNWIRPSRAFPSGHASVGIHIEESRRRRGILVVLLLESFVFSLEFGVREETNVLSCHDRTSPRWSFELGLIQRRAWNGLESSAHAQECVRNTRNSRRQPCSR